MKKKVLKLLLVTLIAALTLIALASCEIGDLSGNVVVTVKDGEETVTTFTFKKDDPLSIPVADLEKTGYELEGIYTDPELTQKFSEGTAVENLTLYVKYRLKTLYLIIDDGTGEESRVNVKYGEAYELTAPVREGYRFLNYSYMGQEFPLTGNYEYTSSIPIVAKWKKIAYLNVFDGTNTVKVEIPEDGKWTLPNVADTNDARFGGYLNGATLFGSYDSASGKWVGEYKGEDDIFLTYKWTPFETFTLTVNGLYGDDVVAPKAYRNGATYTLPANPTRSGYFFKGYKIGNNAVAASGVYTWTNDITVTAVWQKQATIKVYNGVNLVETILVPENGAYTLTAGTDTATHTFEGFKVGNEVFPQSGTYLGEDDLIVMQVYTAIPTYTLTVNGLYRDDVVAPQNYKTGDVFTLPVLPTREGYIFAGYTVGGEALSVDAQGKATFVWSANTTVVANWTARVYLTVRDQLTGAIVGTVEVVDGAYDLTAFVPAETEKVDATKIYTYLGFKLGNDAFAQSGTYNGASAEVTVAWNVADRVFIKIQSIGYAYSFADVEVRDGSYTVFAAPSQAGYYFLGFFTDAECTQAFANDGVYSGETTVYAKWRRAASIKVYNGATLVETVTVNADGSYTLTAGIDTATHTFEGFKLGNDAFAQSGTYLGEDDLVVMQVYEAIPTYLLTVNGLYGNDVVAPQSYKNGDVFTLPVAPTRDGYIFAGYTVGGEALSVDAEGKATFAWSANTTVVANWTARVYLTVRDQLTGAVEGTIEVVDGAYDLTAFVPDVTEKVDGEKIYTYLGFKLGNTDFAVSGTYNGASAEVTVAWSGIDRIFINIVSVGASYNFTRVEVTDGNYTVFATPSQAGYYFLGFFTDAECTEAFANDGVYSGETTVYAKWRRAASIKVYNGATLVETVTVNADGSYTLTAGTDTATHTFEGFKLGNDAFAQSGTYLGEDDLMVFQVYEAIPTYLLTVNGLYGNDVVAPQSYKNGDVFTLPVLPTREGYIFAGYTVGGEALIPDAEGKATFAWSANTTVVANWTARVYLTVRDQLTGAVVGTVEVVDGAYDLTAFVPAETEKVDATKIYTYLGFKLGNGAFDQSGTYNGASAEVTIAWNVADRVFIKIQSIGYAYSFADVEVRDGSYTVFAAPSQAGYYFLGFFTDAECTEAFANDGVYSGETTVYAKWRRAASIKVYNGATLVETVTVNADGSYTLTAGTDTATHTFEGFRLGNDAFAQSGTYLGEEDLIVMQVYTAIPTYLLTVNGLYGNDVVAPQSYKNGDVFTLPVAPTREGYIFAGYTVGGAALSVDAEGKATFVWTANTTVVANWSERIYVSIYNGNELIGKIEIIDGAATLPVQTSADSGKMFNGYTAPGLTFVKNGDGTYSVSGLTANVQVAVSWYTLPVISFNSDGGSAVNGTVTLVPGENQLPVPTRDGYKFLGWYLGEAQIIGEDGKYVFSPDSWAIGTSAHLVAKWLSNDETGEVVGMEYFKEFDEDLGDIVYVFLTGVDNYYIFNGRTLSIANNNGYVTLNAERNGFIANKPGNFTMTLTSADGSTRTVNCRVESRVTIMNSNKKDDEDYAKNFQSGINPVIDAGIVNLIPDVAGKFIDGNAIVTLGTNSVPNVITVEIWNGESYEIITDGYTVENGAISFDSSFDGKQVRISIVPKYCLAAEKEAKTVTFEYLLNTGVNVYTNKEMFEAYGNTAIHQINLLRDITAQVDPSQAYNGNINYPLNVDEYNGIYVRVPTASDSITINGNSYRIDASSVALFDPANGGFHNDGAGYCGENTYYYLNVHSGIFTYEAQRLSDDKNAEFKINDLYIHGNFDGDFAATSPVLGSDKTLLRGSQTYNGIIVRHGYLTVDNTRIDNTNVAIQTWGYDDLGPRGEGMEKHTPGNPNKLYTKLDMSNTQIDVTFAQSVYAWGLVGIDVSNSYIGQSSGAAFHLSDSPIVAGNPYDGYLNIDSATQVENFVAGTEPWFVAFSMADAAAVLKANLDAGIAPYGLTALQIGENNTEFFNFIVCCDDAGGARFSNLDATVDPSQTSDELKHAYVNVNSNGATVPTNVPIGFYGMSVAGGNGFYFSDPGYGLSLLLEIFPRG